MRISHKKLHNILPAFRGPDKKSDKKFKIITVAIRSYLGFTEDNFKGQLLVKGDWPHYCTAITALFGKSKPNHYQEHLIAAVRAIGIMELDQFVYEACKE